MSQPSSPNVDELLARAIHALSDGDRAAADELAGQVLIIDRGNADAEDLLAAPPNHGEIRRLTIMFADLVDSTALSTRIDPEIYRTVVGRYKEQVRRVVDRYEGHIASTKGDGLLIVFGHPTAHENDVQRAVQAGLDIVREVVALSDRVRQRFGFEIQVRVGIHRGVVYLDLEQDDVYGLAANLAARVSGLAPPDSVLASSAVEPLIRDQFELDPRPPQAVKGIEGLVDHFRVIAERPTAARRPPGHLVGRASEVKYLEASWAKAAAGTLDLPGVAFGGEAGIGKSRLARAAVELAQDSDAVVLELYGSPFHTDVGLHPVRRLLERRCGITRSSHPADRLRLLTAELDDHALDTDTMVPLLAPVLGIAPQAGYRAVHADGRKLYEQIAVAVHEYLMSCLGDGQPALLLAEDMHWFDEDTIEVVTSLLNERTGRLMVVMTSRDDAPVLSGSGTRLFELKPLTTAETDELIGALDPDMTATRRRAVQRRCDGIPLYIEEVVAKLKSAQTNPSEAAPVPDSLYEALFARLRSSTEAFRVIEAAATIGSHIDRGLLLAVVDLDDRAGDEVIRELGAGQVLEALGDGSLRFRHELLREVAAELPPPTLRRRLHGRIADAMAAVSESNPDWPVVAGHYERAQRYVEAALAYQQASSDARRRGSVGEARSHLNSAISQIEHAEPGPERDRIEIQLRLRRGFLIYAAEGVSSPNAAAEFERCLEISGTILNDDLFATLSALYGYYAIRADLSRVDQLLASVRDTLDGAREWFRPYNTAGFGMLAWYRGEFGQALELLEAAAAERSEEGARALEAVWFMPNEATASIYTHLALARCTRGDLSGAEAELDRTARRCAEVDFPQGAFSLAYAHQTEFLIRVEAGQLDLAAKVAVDLAGIAEQHGFDSWAFAGAAQVATVDALSALTKDGTDPAMLETHIATLDMFVSTWRSLGVISLITFYDAIVARLLIAAGRLSEARERVDVALALAEETQMKFHDAELIRIRAHTHQDDDERAADLARSIRLAREQGAIIYELRSAADDFQLRGEPARQVLLDAVDRFPDGSVWPPLASAQGLLE